MSLDQTAKGRERKGTSSQETFIVSTYHTGCFTKVLSLSLYDISKGRCYYTTFTNKETAAQRGDVPFQKALN